MEARLERLAQLLFRVARGNLLRHDVDELALAWLGVGVRVRARERC